MQAMARRLNDPTKIYTGSRAPLVAAPHEAPRPGIDGSQAFSGPSGTGADPQVETALS
jgi:hypothetical protein